MTFLWPGAFWFLLALPALVCAYVAMLHRRHQRALRYASLIPVREGMRGVQRIRPHVPALLFLSALVAIVVAAARPALVVTPPPPPERTLIVVIDASISMQATDVAPSRLAVAQAIAKAVVEWQPRDVRVAVIAFSHHADLMQPATSSHEDALAAIDEIELRYGSGIGTGLMAALIVLFPGAGIGAAYDVFAFRAPAGYFDAPVAGSRRPEPQRHEPAPPGSSATQAVVLLTDGFETGGIPAMWAAQIAADRGIPVYTVGIGTPRGAIVEVMHAAQHMQFDAGPLKRIADLTRGKYFYAGTAAELEAAYRGLRSHAVFEARDREITALLAAVAVALLLASAGLSLLWFSTE